jgi:dipeptidase E
MKKQIIAIGGHGLVSQYDKPINQYLIKSSKKKSPKIAFLGTATGDSSSYVSRFYDAFSRLDCKASHLELFNLNYPDYREYLLDQDIIYVGGGNTFSMLSLWGAWGIDEILKEAYDKGIILSGSSAGSVCWFEGCNTDSFSAYYHGDLDYLDCLGFLPYSHSPHYDGEEKRRKHFQDGIDSGELIDGYGMDNYAGIHFIDEKVNTVFSSKEGANSYFVEKKGKKVVEQVLKVDKKLK